MSDYDSIDAYDYELAPELIAEHPTQRRPESRLMVGSPTLTHARFADIARWLGPGDLLVVNDVAVVAARVLTRKRATQGRVELFVVDVIDPAGQWDVPTNEVVLRCMTRASKPVRIGQELVTDGEATFSVIDSGAGFATVRAEVHGMSAAEFLQRHGAVPLPPYIVRRREQMGLSATDVRDHDRYQTVYAGPAGAVAAPTAGLHFDEPLLSDLKAAGVRLEKITLEVGPGTFRPVTTDRLSEHVMHSERYHISDQLGAAIQTTQRDGGRVFAVGTTVLRALEAEGLRDQPFAGGTRHTDLFVRPGFDFRVVDALVTNFHLPRSTLLALVFAFGGPQRVRAMYEAAIANRYRFYSYGDAMLLFRDPS